MTANLAEALSDYLTLRRSMGFSLTRVGQLLSGFVAWLDQQGIAVVTVDATVAWARLSAAPIASGDRVSAVRGFAAYLHTIDPVHELIPPGMMPGHRQRAVPYLYSDTDVTAVMARAQYLKTPLRRATIATAIGLLAVTGMRIGEVVGLDDSDFDPAGALLTVRHTKFGKQRLLPLHTTAVAAIEDYRRLRDREFPNPVSAALLVTGAGTPLTRHLIEATFRVLTRQAGLQPRSPRCRPRPHDLRHTFAVRTLLDWYRDGCDVDARMPSLSTYLGHVCPANTYWYLTATAELLAEAAHRLDTHFADSGDPS